MAPRYALSSCAVVMRPDDRDENHQGYDDADEHNQHCAQNLRVARSGGRKGHRGLVDEVAGVRVDQHFSFGKRFGRSPHPVEFGARPSEEYSRDPTSDTGQRDRFGVPGQERDAGENEWDRLEGEGRLRRIPSEPDRSEKQQHKTGDGQDQKRDGRGKGSADSARLIFEIGRASCRERV